jgi:hypothetical protein
MRTAMLRFIEAFHEGRIGIYDALEDLNRRKQRQQRFTTELSVSCLCCLCSLLFKSSCPMLKTSLTSVCREFRIPNRLKTVPN